MATNFIGQIIPVGFTFAPPGYLPCDGSLQNISDYPTLFQLIGTTYGGDGATTFGLPDLRCRMAIHQGSQGNASYPLGQSGGTESVTLTSQQNALHTHPIAAQGGTGSSASPASSVFAGSSVNQYGSSSANTTANILAATGGNQPHENRMPLLAVNYFICTQGLYPSA